MRYEDFLNLLDRCGADRGAWPPGAAAAADRLLATSPQARSALEAVQGLEEALRATRAPSGDLAALALTASAGVQRRPWPAPAAAAAGLAAAAAVLSLGVLAGGRPPSADDPAVLVALGLGAGGDLGPQLGAQDAD